MVALVAGTRHRMDGRPLPPSPAPALDARGTVQVRGGHGVVGDRYAGRPAHRDASMTVLAVEALEAVAAELGAAPFDPHAARRTVVLRGAEVEALRGRGGVRCAPLTDGLLRVGPAVLRAPVPLDAARTGDPIRPLRPTRARDTPTSGETAPH